jgi:hypothetical protein
MTAQHERQLIRAERVDIQPQIDASRRAQRARARELWGWHYREVQRRVLGCVWVGHWRATRPKEGRKTEKQRRVAAGFCIEEENVGMGQPGRSRGLLGGTREESR